MPVSASTDTLAANALDDYEEHIYSWFGATTQLFQLLPHLADKIAQICYMSYLRLNDKQGLMDGIVTIKDLPFTIDNVVATGVDGGGIVQYYSNLADTSITKLTLRQIIIAIDARIYYAKTGQSMDGLDDSDINSSWNFRA